MKIKSLIYKLFICFYFILQSVSYAGCLDLTFSKMFSEINQKMSIFKEKRKQSKIYPLEENNILKSDNDILYKDYFSLKKEDIEANRAQMLGDLINECKKNQSYSESFFWKKTKFEIRRINNHHLHNLLKKHHRNNYKAFYIEDLMKVNRKRLFKRYSDITLLPELYAALVYQTGESEEGSSELGVGFRFMFILTITKSNAEYKENFLYEITNIDFPKLTVKISRIPKKDEISKSPLSSFKNPLEEPVMKKKLFVFSFSFANHLIEKLATDKYLPNTFFKSYFYVYPNEDEVVRITQFGYNEKKGYFQKVIEH